MRALIQRVNHASVSVDTNIVGEIDRGLLVFICAMRGDGDAHVTKLTQKISKLRIFPDDTGKMNLSLRDIQGAVLLVSQFTLAADTRSGNRPGFSGSADVDDAKRLYNLFSTQLRALGIVTEQGKFGADMQVTLTNDGPVTIWLDTDD
jgi:D-tyrosyl-tRNA(Tyr) deacylase